MSEKSALEWAKDEMAREGSNLYYGRAIAVTEQALARGKREVLEELAASLKFTAGPDGVTVVEEIGAWILAQADGRNVYSTEDLERARVLLDTR